MNLETWVKSLDEDVEASFRQAILTDPCDVSNYLVYADWLDEHGRNGKTIRRFAEDLPRLLTIVQHVIDEQVDRMFIGGAVWHEPARRRQLEIHTTHVLNREGYYNIPLSIWRPIVAPLIEDGVLRSADAYDGPHSEYAE